MSNDDTNDDEQYEQDLRSMVNQSCEMALDEGMSYQHMAAVMFEYGRIVQQISIRGKAIDECERAVGHEIDVSAVDKSVIDRVSDEDSD